MFIGAQNIGKTTMIRRLLPLLGLGRVHVQTNAIESYRTDTPESLIHSGYNEELLNRHMDAGDCAAIVLDDCPFFSDELNTPTFRRLMSQTKATVFVTMLYGMGMPPAFDYAFIFRTGIVSNQRRLYNFYCKPHLFPSLEEFGRTLMSETEYVDENGFSRLIDGACLVVADCLARYRTPNKYEVPEQDNVTAATESEVAEVRHDED